MLLTAIKRLLTVTPAVEGTWVKKSAIEIEDSYLGTLLSDEPYSYNVNGTTHTTNIVFRKPIQIADFGEIELSFLDYDDLNTELQLARSVVAGLPGKNYLYRLLLAWHHRDVHRLLYKGPILSVRELASRLTPYRIQISRDVSSFVTAEIWYSPGNLLDGANVCLVLDEKRRYVAAAMG